MQLNGFKFVRLPKEPTKGEDGVQEDVKGKEKALVKGRRLKDKLLASPEGVSHVNYISCCVFLEASMSELHVVIVRGGRD